MSYKAGTGIVKNNGMDYMSLISIFLTPLGSVYNELFLDSVNFKRVFEKLHVPFKN